LPGGGLEYGEEFEECAIREVKEETNLDIVNPIVHSVINDKDKRAHWVTIGMHTTGFGGELQITEPDKFAEWKWFKLNELPENIFFPSRRVIERFVKKSSL